MLVANIKIEKPLKYQRRLGLLNNIIGSSHFSSFILFCQMNLPIFLLFP